VQRVPIERVSKSKPGQSMMSSEWLVAVVSVRRVEVLSRLEKGQNVETKRKSFATPF
jgi:hypothetical protein